MHGRIALVGLGALPLVAARGELTLGALVTWILIGAVVGLIARLLVPGRNALGILATILVGIVGALLGGWLAEMLNATRIVTWIIAVAVATLLVWLLTRAGARRRFGRRTI
jgi:uncharacterized membrane protein YeaQ/YmgE (transglycosylase-associated protein family)